LVAIGVSAVAASAVVAGAAAAAKGGNSENAHACPQGGHENRFEAETGRPFKNAGDCTSHGAQGGASSSLVITPPPDVPLFDGNVLGFISGSGLNVTNHWMVFIVGQRFPSFGREPGADSTATPPAAEGRVGPHTGPPRGTARCAVRNRSRCGAPALARCSISAAPAPSRSRSGRT